MIWRWDERLTLQFIACPLRAEESSKYKPLAPADTTFVIYKLLKKSVANNIWGDALRLQYETITYLNKFRLSRL
jgi:hypothetical protein